MQLRYKVVLLAVAPLVLAAGLSGGGRFAIRSGPAGTEIEASLPDRPSAEDDPHDRP